MNAVYIVTDYTDDSNPMEQIPSFIQLVLNIELTTLNPIVSTLYASHDEWSLNINMYLLIFIN